MIPPRQLWIIGAAAMVPIIVGAYDMLLVMPRVLSSDPLEAFGMVPDGNRNDFVVMFIVWLAIIAGAIWLSTRKPRPTVTPQLDPTRRLVVIVLLVFSTAAVSVMLPFTVMSIGIHNVVGDVVSVPYPVSFGLALVGVATAIVTFVVWLIWEAQVPKPNGPSNRN